MSDTEGKLVRHALAKKKKGEIQGFSKKLNKNLSFKQEGSLGEAGG